MVAGGGEEVLGGGVEEVLGGGVEEVLGGGGEEVLGGGGEEVLGGGGEEVLGGGGWHDSVPSPPQLAATCHPTQEHPPPLPTSISSPSLFLFPSSTPLGPSRAEPSLCPLGVASWWPLPHAALRECLSIRWEAVERARGGRGARGRGGRGGGGVEGVRGERELPLSSVEGHVAMVVKGGGRDCL